MISSGGAIVEQAAVTANRAIVSNASGLPIASTTTDTQLALLATNLTFANGILRRDGTGAFANFVSAYGGVYADNSATTTTPAGGIGTYTKIASFTTVGASNSGTTVSGASQNITVLNAGIYHIFCSASISNSGSGREMRLAVRNNGTVLNNMVAKYLNITTTGGTSTTGEYVNLFVCGFVTLAINDVIDAAISSSSAAAVNVQFGNLIVRQMV